MSKQQFNITGTGTLRDVMMEVWRAVCQLVGEERKGVRVTVQTASTRSLDQNSRMWAMLAEISNQVNWYGRKLSPTEWKDVFSASLKKQDVVPNIDNTGFVILGARTSEMSIKEMGELMELMEAFGVQHNVRFTAPEYRHAA